MAASIRNYDRVCSDLTVLASLKSRPGQDKKLVYSQNEGLDTESAGYLRSIYSGLNKAASWVGLASGYSRDIIDLTPIIANISEYCSSEDLATLERADLQTLQLKIALATDGLSVLIKKYSGQPEKEQIIASASDSLTKSYQKVEAQISRPQESRNDSSAIFTAAKDLVAAVKELGVLQQFYKPKE